jgi:alcohol dehydrogenase (NADP+)
MSSDYKFQGWMGLDKTAAEGNLKWQEYEPKQWEETDVDIEVVLASDLTNRGTRC